MTLPAVTYALMTLCKLLFDITRLDSTHQTATAIYFISKQLTVELGNGFVRKLFNASETRNQVDLYAMR